ncbi:hypothetical protein TTHERM_00327170 (macronuclear) [Tetrahymena thermophila SB210]|uniref:Uncharacterized protein n=1 Tax=Tetrahymena thermophila (strain SB210) TaxID=312017 RepID=I7MJF8_TETTS|nr:hypothetical protein TTHERM_00327170 [Tetrahymena thermophila SB210]EAS06235.1 hypothetical protein TTHERM_00327170 [Tetrahymena thermophila SB210]|eukprot:XP_001026480.1 hypothetical protein TTHERM_00327170 [Tetrahymena thermophila SB210]
MCDSLDSSQLISSFNQTSDTSREFLQALNQDKQDSENDKNNKKLICKSQIKQAQKYQARIELFNNLLSNNNDSMHLFVGLQITPDGVMRYNYSTDYLCFGYSQQQIFKIVDDKDLDIVNIVYQRNCKISQTSFDEALATIQKIPNIPYEYAKNVLEETHKAVYFVYEKIIGTEINDQVLMKKEEDLLAFLQYFAQILQNYKQENPNKMYWYILTRINYVVQNSEIIHSGFSKAYLNLLGIDADTFTKIFLRGKKIDLIQNRFDIYLQSLLGLEVIDNTITCKNNEIDTFIVTFDGFPIKITQKKVCTCFSEKIQEGRFSDFGFNITEIDVDIDSLKQLIDYRQRAFQNTKFLNIDDFIRRELSYQFEDVEYSIQSQNFIEKYYKENVQKIKKIEKQYKSHSYKKAQYKDISN